jgi:hypothetical protein
MVQIDTTRILEEAKDADFSKDLAAFQARFDCLQKDNREKLRLCLHEAGHMVYFRRIGWGVEKLHGAFMQYREGELHYALGGVTRGRGELILRDDTSFLEWEIAKCSVAGFALVEALTGVPDSQDVIDGDMRLLREELEHLTPEIFEMALNVAKRDILRDVQRSAFLNELLQAVREYEQTIFHTDETWRWGLNEYRLDLPGVRYRVRLVPDGWGLLLDDRKQLRLVVDGKEYAPGDGIRLQVVSSKKSVVDAIRRWNEQVSTSVSARTEGEKYVR